MESLIIDATAETPGVILENQTGFIELNGKSIMNDPTGLYSKIESWMDDYTKNPCPVTHAVFNLEQINLSSSKRILFIMYKLAELKKSGNVVSISWYYRKQNDMVHEQGKDFAFMVDVPFDFHLNAVKSSSYSVTI